jgi:hypothetical protein
MTPSVTTPDAAKALPDTTPVLRTLSPALRGLERGLRGWLDAPREYTMGTLQRAALEGLSTDLRRQSDALDVERPLLVVMLMGGTGVGKSTLLNALAGGNVALASFTRPTTRDPVVYYHESVRPDRLDPALRHCRLVSHDRRPLEQKIIVDTPDLDSTDLANREKTLRLLPVADVVLFIGSQEKYHDQLGWDIFRQQRKRRAFAFVMNKWDRCLHAGASGLRPDEDLIRDLESEGFVKPLVFRTCAQAWVDRATGAPPGDLPEGEQFQELMTWLEMGLSRLEIEAIKARGVSQMIAHLQHALRDAAPPDLTDVAERSRKAWAAPLEEEARATADVLVNTLEPFQREIEHHFTLEGHGRFRGTMMAWYLGLFDKAKYAGSHLRPRIPFISRSQPAAEAPARWDLSMFSSACGDVAGSRELDARGKALVNRLLVAADTQGYPLTILTEPVEAVGRIDWRQRWAASLTQVLDRVEKRWTNPGGPRKAVQSTLVLLAYWLPPAVLLASLVMVLIRFFDPWNIGYQFTWHHALLPAMVVLLVLVLLHVLIAVLLPMRWGGIRDELHRQLEAHVQKELEAAYLPVPVELSQRLKEERRRIEKLTDDAREVGAWLEKREQASSIAGLYGH